MVHEDVIKNKVYNIELVVEEIKKFPQTYNTILREFSCNGTIQFILRRKLIKLCKDGTICKGAIPGTRFGMAIFYTVPKEYNILVEASRTGISVYCFFKYKRIDKFFIKSKDCWLLINDHWAKCRNPKTFFEGNVLRWF